MVGISEKATNFGSRHQRRYCNGDSHAADVGGFFTDPNHYKDGSFAGTRMISDECGDTPGTRITLVGSDDGTAFWMLTGEFVDKSSGKITVDFSPKGGPSCLSGVFKDDQIVWEDGNHWSRMAMSKPKFDALI
mmetsp:Transcript_774/g.1230  ORF Transcript_774/g.1230 Transcript_774/m.1230 type:complete len:133 (-) Transcript_774:79-477(-)